jgi:hypothetical protein
MILIHDYIYIYIKEQEKKKVLRGSPKLKYKASFKNIY